MFAIVQIYPYLLWQQRLVLDFIVQLSHLVIIQCRQLREDFM